MPKMVGFLPKAEGNKGNRGSRSKLFIAHSFRTVEAIVIVCVLSDVT